MFGILLTCKFDFFLWKVIYNKKCLKIVINKRLSRSVIGFSILISFLISVTFYYNCQAIFLYLLKSNLNQKFKKKKKKASNKVQTDIPSLRIRQWTPEWSRHSKSNHLFFIYMLHMNRYRVIKLGVAIKWEWN